jgi:hypothetical protein
MKALSLDKAQISLVLAISLIGGLTFRFARVDQLGEMNNTRMDKLETKMDRVIEIVPAFKLLENKVEKLEKPLLNTQFNVKRMKAQVNRIAKKQSDSHVEACTSCKLGPIGMFRLDQ